MKLFYKGEEKLTVPCAPVSLLELALHLVGLHEQLLHLVHC